MDQFKQNILNFNEQLSSKTIKFSNLNKLKNEKIDAIIIIGMGGSGQVGNIVLNLKKELNINVPILCWKDWDLPENSFENPLYIFISFSGNTEETISGIKKAKNKAVITSGGKMLKIAKEQELPFAYFVNSGIKPRQSNGIMFFAVLGLLKKYFPGLKIDKISLENSEKQGKSLASKLKNKIILLYSSFKNAFLTYNWKTRLNETSKSLAFAGILPEICHNEIETLENKKFKKQIIITLFESGDDNKKVKERIQKIKKILKLKGISLLEIKIEGKNKLESAFNSMLLADWTSYYLAKATKVDPAKTSLIDLLKSIK